MKKHFPLLWIFLGVLFAIVFSLFLINQTNLKTVVIVGDSAKIKGLSILNNQNLLFIKKGSVIRELLEINPVIKNISVEKRYPNILILQIDERHALVQVKNGIHSVYFDREGIIIENKNVSSVLPIINADKISISEEKKADWRIMKAIKIVEDLQRVDINIENISTNDDENNFLVTLTQGEKVIIPYGGESANIAASLQIIIHRFRIEGKFVEKIDFRFEKPTVSLSNGEKISSVVK